MEFHNSIPIPWLKNWYLSNEILYRPLLHAICTGQRATKLLVLFQSYLLQVMYMTFQYLTVSCIPAIGYVPNISRYRT